MTTTRRRLLTGTAGLAVAMPTIARGAGTKRWRCVTSWARNMPGPGVSTRRLAERITLLSQRELVIDVFAAGEIVPALQTFDAVSAGTVEMAHTAAVFWSGKMPAAPLFCTAPFGLSPTAHMAWLDSGAQAQWDALYAPHRVKPFIAGNTGPSAAGWFRREIKTLADMKGLRIRATGIGGEVYAALGATPLAIPPADTYAALERGVIDAVELLAPANDLPSGFNRIAPFYGFPGFNKPNGASELLIAEAAWNSLSTDLQRVVEVACRTEHDVALAECETANAAAMAQLSTAGTTAFWLGDDVLAAARTATQASLERIAKTGTGARSIVDSYMAFRESSSMWRRLSDTARARLG